jgi:hypothetical protein
MKKVVSFSLWGAAAKYNVGAVRNAALCRDVYPGWTPRFYLGASVPAATRDELRRLDAEIIEMNEPGDWRGMFWRFEAASDPAVEVMLSRDCDSRLSPREAAAVAEWLASGAPFHIMRDHPWHRARILGGMWGLRAPLLREMSALIAAYAKGDFWQVDQHFLRDVVYPRVKRLAWTHDEFFRGRRFPTQRRGLEFVGQGVDEHEHPASEAQQALANELNAGFLRASLRRWRLR